MQFLGNGLDVVTGTADVHASEPKRLQRNDRILGRKRRVDGAEQQAFQVGQSLQRHPCWSAMRETRDKSASQTRNSGA